MKITVITGSPHRKGTTALLADEFIRGAEEAGNEVYRFDSAFKRVSPCLGCDGCRRNNGVCVQRDPMDELNPHLLEADAIVFVTPLYYFGFSAEIKAVIDRFYANNAKLMGAGKKSALIAASGDDQDWTLKALEASYLTIARYLKFTDAGMVLAAGCSTREDAEHSDYPGKAYELGKGMK